MSRIGYEKNCCFFTASQQEKLMDVCRDATFLPSDGLVEEGRLIKSDYEIELIRKAAKATKAGIQAGEQVVQDAVQAILETIKLGVTAHAADAAGRAIIANSTFGGEQGTRSGYSVGIGLPPDWGEGHILSLQPEETRMLKANMTFHLLPWVQVPGKGGFSFSETIRVTQDGCEVVTNFPRQLFVKS